MSELRAEYRGPSTVEVRGAVHATNLIWQQADTLAEARALARSTSKELGNNASLVCYRDGMRVQYAIGNKSAGHFAGMPSLAASLCDALGATSWIGFWPVENGIYVAAGDQDAVHPRGDILFADESEAEEAFWALYGNDGQKWRRIFAPVHLGLTSASGETLGDLLGDVKAGQLKSIGLLPGIDLSGADWAKLKLLAGLLVVCLAAAGGFGYLKWQEHKRQEEIRLAVEAARAAKARGEAQASAQERPKPWRAAPTPSAMVEACISTLADVQRPGPGWPIAKSSCVPGRVSVEWRRAFASSYEFRKWAERALPGLAISVGTGGEQIVGQAQLGLARRDDDGLTASTIWPAQAITEKITELFQVLGNDVSITPSRPYSDIEIKQAQEEGKPLPPKAQVIRFTTNRLPVEWIGVLSSIPATVVKAVRWEEDAWTIEAEIYEQAR